MLNQSANLTTMLPLATPMMETIKSRFGEISYDSSKALLFPRGLLGMADKANFVLTGFPNPKMQQFMLLQSLDDTAISFITLPLALHNGIIAFNDLSIACHDLQIDESSAAVLLIVTVHRGVDSVRLSVNARAPLLVDADRKMGVQYVFQQDIYKVQHTL